MKKILKNIGIGMTVLLLIWGIYFYVIKQLDEKIVESKEYLAFENRNEISAIQLPSQFIDGERFYLKIAVVGGDTILAYCDTGGGMSMLFPNYNNNAKVNSKIKLAIFKALMPMNYILFDDVVVDNNFPKPVPLRKKILRNPISMVKTPYLIIPPLDQELKMAIKAQPEIRAFLGQDFFMYKSWTIDYIQKNVWVNTPLNKTETELANILKIGFKKNKNQENIFGHPSMIIEVEGDTIDVLFDTGATSILTENGKNQFGTTKKSLGSSFIATSIFQKWRDRHPEWKYYPKAEWLGDMIEVPKIKIGGYEVGPVLFSQRPDEVWSEGMISTMDKVVKGAIGGSALKYFRVTIDYNSELIRFER
jgi:hypothetical protein